jgi:hypothetical protein
VEVSFMDGHAPAGDLPDGWAREHEQLVCLGCRRVALIAAVDARCMGRKIAEERQRALAEFELRRPERWDARVVTGTYHIAGKTVKLAAALVAEVRRQIEQERS